MKTWKKNECVLMFKKFDRQRASLILRKEFGGIKRS